MKRRIHITIAIAVLTLPLAAQALRAAPRSAGSRYFAELGLLVGSETELPHYEESSVRPFFETGVNFARSGTARNNLGLVIGLSMGSDELRYYLGPRLSKRLNPRWRLETSGGLLWSDHDGPYGSHFFDAGWQARLSLKRGGRFSLSYVYQHMGYEVDSDPYGANQQRGVLNASYFGFAMQGEPPPLFSVALAATIAVIWFRASGENWVAQAK